jgi:hypothetical protein
MSMFMDRNRKSLQEQMKLFFFSILDLARSDEDSRVGSMVPDPIIV